MEIIHLTSMIYEIPSYLVKSNQNKSGKGFVRFLSENDFKFILTLVKSLSI